MSIFNIIYWLAWCIVRAPSLAIPAVEEDRNNQPNAIAIWNMSTQLTRHAMQVTGR